ncbi:MAG: hypothetical protein IPG81_19270 [Sandaracinaceae bacterium]|nr:hypothetical protein [Sandaracinaceae bacterium]
MRGERESRARRGRRSEHAGEARGRIARQDAHDARGAEEAVEAQPDGPLRGARAQGSDDDVQQADGRMCVPEEGCGARVGVGEFSIVQRERVQQRNAGQTGRAGAGRAHEDAHHCRIASGLHGSRDAS